MFEYNLYPICILLLLTNLLNIKSFFITITSNDASLDIFDDKGYFEFPPEAEFTSNLQ